MVNTRTISTNRKTDERLAVLKQRYGSYSRAIEIAVAHETFDVESELQAKHQKDQATVTDRIISGKPILSGTEKSNEWRT